MGERLRWSIGIKPMRPAREFGRTGTAIPLQPLIHPVVAAHFGNTTACSGERVVISLNIKLHFLAALYIIYENTSWAGGASLTQHSCRLDRHP